MRVPSLRMKVVSIKVPEWVKEDEFVDDVRKLLEEKYGVVSVETIRSRLGISPSFERIEVDEHEVLALREAEKRRLPQL